MSMLKYQKKRYRIKEIAQTRSLSQERIAYGSGVSLSTVQRLWQNRNTTDPRYSTLLALAGTLGVTVEELYEPDSVEIAEAKVTAPKRKPGGFKGIPPRPTVSELQGKTTIQDGDCRSASTSWM